MVQKYMPSGRWVLTIIAGICLVILVYAHTKKGPEFSIAPEAIAAIITMVFSNYFNKDRDI